VLGAGDRGRVGDRRLQAQMRGLHVSQPLDVALLAKAPALERRQRRRALRLRDCQLPGRLRGIL